MSDVLVNATMAAGDEAQNTRRLRQPPGLKVIFLTEMWERFSFYGMQALLVIYLVRSLKFSSTDALSVYGTYIMLAYLTPILGGWLADRYLGLRLAAVMGATAMMLGHFAMASPSLLYPALGLLAIGNGLFKPSTASLVGELYDGPDDPRRDSGYTIFYMGINIGATLSALVCGTLGETLGWSYGFTSAGVGMAIALVVFIGWQRHLGRAGLRAHQVAIGWRHLPVVGAFAAGSIALVMAVVSIWPPVESLLARVPSSWLTVGGLVAIVLVTALGRWMNERSATYAPLTRSERSRLGALAVIAVLVMFFFVCNAQAGGSMSLFAANQTERHIAGREFPATWFLAVNPVLVMALAPMFSLLWTKVDRSRFPIPDVAKLGLSMLLVGLGFAVMTAAQHRAETVVLVGPGWLVGAYLLQTVGEVILVPIALAILSKTAPERIVGVLMGLWLTTIGVGYKLAGSLESLLAGSGITPYSFLMMVSIAMGLVAIALTPVLDRMLHARDATESSS